MHCRPSEEPPLQNDSACHFPTSVMMLSAKVLTLISSTIFHIVATATPVSLPARSVNVSTHDPSFPRVAVGCLGYTVDTTAIAGTDALLAYNCRVQTEWEGGVLPYGSFFQSDPQAKVMSFVCNVSSVKLAPFLDASDHLIVCRGSSSLRHGSHPRRSSPPYPVLRWR